MSKQIPPTAFRWQIPGCPGSPQTDNTFSTRVRTSTLENCTIPHLLLSKSNPLPTKKVLFLQKTFHLFTVGRRSRICSPVFQVENFGPLPEVLSGEEFGGNSNFRDPITVAHNLCGPSKRTPNLALSPRTTISID